MTRKSYLVTGAAGFIGGALARRLIILWNFNNKRSTQIKYLQIITGSVISDNLCKVPYQIT